MPSAADSLPALRRAEKFANAGLALGIGSASLGLVSDLGLLTIVLAGLAFVYSKRAYEACPADVRYRSGSPTDGRPLTAMSRRAYWGILLSIIGLLIGILSPLAG